MKHAGSWQLVARSALAMFLVFAGTPEAGSARGQDLPACAPGWEVTEIARAPRLHHPTAVALAPDGRVFVCEDKMDMSGPVDRPVNRIVCVHPGGRITVFAEKIYAAFGMEYIDGKLYVHHSPRFSVFGDGGETAGDRVDLIETTNPAPWGSAVRGKNQINDHAPAGFQLAMDGFFYIAVGDKGIHGMAGRDGTKLELPLGGLIRMRPDGTQLEAFATGFRTILNPAINAEDEIFLYDNNDHLNFHKVAVAHVQEGAYYGYPWDCRPPRPAYVLPMDVRVYAGGAPTSILAYEEDGLPSSYRGSLFLCDWGRQELVRLKVERQGASYRVAAEEKILSGAFRPTGIAVSSDGLSFFVGDWQHSGWRDDVDAGRLLKVTYRGESQAAARPAWYQPAAMGRQFRATTEELVEGLSHPARTVRMVAQRRLVDRGVEAAEALIRLLGNASASGWARRHAIWALDALGGVERGRAAILEAVDDADSSIRIQAIRAVGERRIGEGQGRLLARSADPDPAVRRQAIAALGRVGHAGAVSTLRDRLDDQDMLVRYAAFTALNQIGRRNPAAWTTVIEGLVSDRVRVREGTALALRETYDPELIAVLARFAGPSSHHRGTVRAPACRVLLDLARKPPQWDGLWWRLGPLGFIEDSYDATPRLPKTREWDGTPAVIEALRRGLDDSDATVRRIAIEGASLKLDQAVIGRLVRMFDDPALAADRPAILRVLGAASEPSAAGPILSVLANPARCADLLPDALAAARQKRGAAIEHALTKLAGEDIPSNVLVLALRALGDLRVVGAVPIVRIRASHSATAVRAAAAKALGEIGTEHAADGLISCLNDSDLAIRREALGGLGLLRARSAVPALIHAYRDPRTRVEAGLALARIPDVRALDIYLDGLVSKSPGLRDDCRRALSAIRELALPMIRKKMAVGALPPAISNDLKLVYEDNPAVASLLQSAGKDITPEDYSAFALAHDGDPKRGRAIFADTGGTGCAKCHRVNGDGGQGGPDLSHIASNQTRRDLIESILSPSRKVADGYRLTTIALVQGEVVSGVVIDVKSDALTLVDIKGDKRTIRHADIVQKVERDSSAMPDGLQTGLTREEFADLVAYLESLK
jgi:putative heme-binding domain-containing protein